MIKKIINFLFWKKNKTENVKNVWNIEIFWKKEIVFNDIALKI